MRPIPPKIRKALANDPTYATCLRKTFFNDHQCQADPVTGKLIEWEHAFIYSGRQINETWAIIPICWWVHRGPGLDKDKNRFLALRRATVKELYKYPNKDWLQLLEYLNKKYVIPKQGWPNLSSKLHKI